MFRYVMARSFGFTVWAGADPIPAKSGSPRRHWCGRDRNGLAAWRDSNQGQQAAETETRERPFPTRDQSTSCKFEQPNHALPTHSIYCVPTPHQLPVLLVRNTTVYSTWNSSTGVLFCVIKAALLMCSANVAVIHNTIWDAPCWLEVITACRALNRSEKPLCRCNKTLSCRLAMVWAGA